MFSSQYTVHTNPTYQTFTTPKRFQHIGIKQKLVSPISHPKKHKLCIDSLRTIKGQHYNDTRCDICKVLFASTHQAHEHIASSKHLKKMLEYGSNGYQNECIYCNIQFADEIEKNNHLSSIGHHSTAKQILQQLKQPLHPTPYKSESHSTHVIDAKHIHVKGIKHKHYTDTYCHVCDIQFSANNSSNLIAHLNGSKHIKNVLACYSSNYNEQCIYCNVCSNTNTLRHAHISSLKHTDFVNGIITETQSKYTQDKQWIISLEECNKRIDNGSVSVTKKKKAVPVQTVSATRIRKAIKDCYDDHSMSSVEQQLNLLEKLCNRSDVLNEKDYVSILFCVSSLMRTNDISIISDGLGHICKLFERSQWKMDHKLFEQIIDIIILSVNVKQLMHDFDELIQQNMNIRDAFKLLLGMDAEKKFLEPFNYLFECFNDMCKWNDASFENESAHKYFMKWSQLIFKDMIYNLRDIRYCQQTDFDLNYKLLMKKSYESINELPININNIFELRKYCCFKEVKRVENGPFTNITMSTPLSCSLDALSNGSFVILFPEIVGTNVIDNTQCIVGYIYKMGVSSQTITLRIADHDYNIQNNCKWHLLSMGASAASFESQFEALQKITTGNVSTQLGNLLYNYNESHSETNQALIETKLTSQLNESQRLAVQSVFNNGNITLIQGPPGTGKTHVAAAIAEQFLKQCRTGYGNESFMNCRPKILLSAFSNIAVDVLTERVLLNNLYPVRIGADSTLPMECGALLNSYPVWEWQHKINFTDIICATSIGTANDMLKNIQFDLILIDETTQSTEAGLLVALSKLKDNGKVVLIGDHKQLPPTVLSANAIKNGLGVSLYERLINDRNIKPHFLNTQYRMHPKLAEFPSLYFYNNQLLTGINENDREICKGFNWPIEGFPIAFVQTCDDAKEQWSYTSTVNMKEAEIVIDIVYKLLENNNNNITVISPYSAQKKLIDDSLYKMLSYEQKKKVKVRTVDGFQGSECDIIVFSATRSNDDSVVGFLRDYRRINVMLTRPKNGLIVVGNRNTLANGDPLWNNWLKYVCDVNEAIVTDYNC